MGKKAKEDFFVIIVPYVEKPFLSLRKKPGRKNLFFIGLKNIF